MMRILLTSVLRMGSLLSIGCWAQQRIAPARVLQVVP
jgi:hypothetical protein